MSEQAQPGDHAGEANDQSEGESTSPSRVVALPEGEYAKYLAELAARIADTKAKEREARWRGFIGAALTVLAFLGYTSFTSLKSDLKTVLGAELSTEVADTVESYFRQNKDQIVGEALKEFQRQIDSRIAFVQFVDLVDELASRTTGFTNQERDAANGLLQEVVASTDLVERPQFRLALEKLVDTYAAADLEAYIDDIDDILGDVATSSPGIAVTMTIHYGLRVTGKAALEDDDLARFLKYADAAERHKFPEASTPFRMGLAFRTSGEVATETTRHLIEDAHHFTPDEQLTFLQSLKSYQNVGDSGKFSRVGRLFVSLWSAHASELESLSEQAGPLPDSDAEVLPDPRDAFLDLLSQ